MFHPRRLQRCPHWLLKLWPQWPLAIAMMLTGTVSAISHLRFPEIPWNHISPLLSISKSLGALGRGAQILLGAGQVLVGIGLFWRLASAWAFAVLLLAITIGVNLVQQIYGPGLAVSAVLLLFLLFFKNTFTRRTFLANFALSIISILAVLAYGTLGTYLMGVDFHPHVKDLVSAFYFTVITLSTVGYGDIAPATPDARLFVISLLVVGLSIFATAIISALGPTISGELARVFNPKEQPMTPKDHVILVGEGPFACNTARELQKRGIVFVQIMAKGFDPPLPDQLVIHGTPDDDGVLKEAGIDNAHMLIAAKEDDGENAFISLIAKDHNPGVEVLAIAGTVRSIRRLKLARADLVFAPAVVGSRLLADLVEGNEISAEFNDLLERKARQS